MPRSAKMAIGAIRHRYPVLTDQSRPMTSPVHCAEFGPFQLFPQERRLTRAGDAVPVGGRALDILTLLIENAGHVVSKQVLFERVWPDITVEESSLRVHIAGLRRAIGDRQDGTRYITNVAGRGYCFIGQVNIRDRTPPARTPETDRADSLPRRSTRIIGREKETEAVAALLADHRFVTIHGPGGIGKTTVAIAVAEHRRQAFADGIRFLDLGLQRPGGSIADALAAELGLQVRVQDPTTGIVNALRDRHLLLVLDGCEHVIGSAAPLAEHLVAELPQVAVLATSRESLRVEGEQVFPLSPLAVPPETVRGTDDMLRYPAMRLFHERVVAAGHRSDMTEEDLKVAAGICRKVDGIALALELTAGRVGAYGLKGTADLLDGRMKLQWEGRRTAHPRHQTLHATLDWSHDLIAAQERTVLRRLSVFVGHFTLEEAQAVVGNGSVDAAGVAEALAQLVAASLVVADTGATPTRYRLLDATRAYAQAKLAESDESRSAAAAHAQHYSERLARTKKLADAIDEGAIAAEMLGNVRAALDWSFSEAGNLDLAIRITAGFSHLFLAMALLRECRQWTQRAIAALPESMLGTRTEMALQLGFGKASMLMKGNSEPARAALERGAEIAERLGECIIAYLAINNLFLYFQRAADFKRMAAAVARAQSLTTAHGIEHLVNATRLMQTGSCLVQGKLSEAHAAVESALDPSPGITVGRTMLRTRLLWLRGFPDQAAEAAHDSCLAQLPDHVIECQALLWGINVFLWRGNWTSAEDYTDRLIRLTREHGLETYETVALGYSGEILLHRGKVEAGMALLRDVMARLHAEGYLIQLPGIAIALCNGLAAQGHFDQALALADEHLALVARIGSHFLLPELQRVRGEVLARAGDTAGAEEGFHIAIATADAQGALSWRLRAATSLVHLHLQQGRTEESRGTLAETFGRFTEGFDTADLMAARELLNRLDRS